MCFFWLGNHPNRFGLSCSRVTNMIRFWSSASSLTFPYHSFGMILWSEICGMLLPDGLSSTQSLHEPWLFSLPLSALGRVCACGYVWVLRVFVVGVSSHAFTPCPLCRLSGCVHACLASLSSFSACPAAGEPGFSTLPLHRVWVCLFCVCSLLLASCLLLSRLSVSYV